MTSQLPEKRRHYLIDSPECPWCGELMDDFAPRWDGVVVMQHPDKPSGICLVSADGDCPECGKPVRVIEERYGDTMRGHTEGRLTELDERYLKLRSQA